MNVEFMNKYVNKKITQIISNVNYVKTAYVLITKKIFESSKLPTFTFRKTMLHPGTLYLNNKGWVLKNANVPSWYPYFLLRYKDTNTNL